MKANSRRARILTRIVFAPGLILWGLIVRVGMYFTESFSGVSPEGRLFVLVLKGYRAWTGLQTNDIAAVRRSQDMLGRHARTARLVRFEPADFPNCPAEWVIPPEGHEGKVILYFHGGGYTTGSLYTHRSLVSHIAKAARTKVLNVAYRLAPEYPYPAAFEDALAAYRWLLGKGYAPGGIALAGDSAGGGLATALLVALRDEVARTGGGRERLPAGAALLSPWVDLSDEKGSWEKLAASDWLLTPESLQDDACKYLGHSCDEPEHLQDPYISPRFADLRGLPPLMVHAGGDELLRDDIRAFTAKARASGVKVYHEEWPGMVHDWHLVVAYLPEGRRAVDEIGVFLRLVLA